MRAKFLYYWEEVLGSYWFVPALMLAGAVLLALLMLRFDAGVGRDLVGEGSWAYTGSAEGARSILSTIAGSMITVTGVVFSIVIVALTLASSQFGPRVLTNFMRDRANQLVLGTFVATFLYCLLVLRSIRSANDDGGDTFVPHGSITLGLLLAVLSLAVLVYFIHHAATSIQAPSIVASIADDLHEGIERLAVDEAHPVDGGEVPELPEGFLRDALAIRAPGHGYLDTIDLEGLFDLAVAHDLAIRIEYRPGHFVVDGDTLALVGPRARVLQETAERIRTSFVIGSRRGFNQDIEYPVHQLVEVAVRALSPGINDPVTAAACLDQLGAGLCHLARRGLPAPHRADGSGALRIAWRDPLTFRTVVDRVFSEIRQNAAHHLLIYQRMLEVLTATAGCATDPADLEPLLHHVKVVRRHALSVLHQEADRVVVEQQARAALRTAKRRRNDAGAGG